jgi:hypothetical protein
MNGLGNKFCWILGGGGSAGGGLGGLGGGGEIAEEIKYLCTYDLYGPVRNVFDAATYITWGSGLGPGNGEFFGPCEMASSR